MISSPERYRTPSVAKTGLTTADDPTRMKLQTTGNRNPEPKRAVRNSLGTPPHDAAIDHPSEIANRSTPPTQPKRGVRGGDLSDFINKCLPYLGVRLVHAKKQPEMELGNTYSLGATNVDGSSLEMRKILNLIAYTKTKKTTYSADPFPAGYVHVTIDGRKFTGQRDAAERLEDVPFNFDGASVLDLGCNHGGMLRAIADRISIGVGLDYDYKLVNAANRISAHNGISNLRYYVFDFDREKLELLPNFYPGTRVDIVFLLSVCVWIKNWTSVIDAARSLSDCLLFESNGAEEGQRRQEAYLRSTYAHVDLVRGASTDDPIYQKRRLFFCRATSTH